MVGLERWDKYYEVAESGSRTRNESYEATRPLGHWLAVGSNGQPGLFILEVD
jgi:hypothetical protein